jgi:hypothetical protein
MLVVFEFRNVKYILKFNFCLRLLALLLSETSVNLIISIMTFVEMKLVAWVLGPWHLDKGITARTSIGCFPVFRPCFWHTLVKLVKEEELVVNIGIPQHTATECSRSQKLENELMFTRPSKIHPFHTKRLQVFAARPGIGSPVFELC